MVCVANKPMIEIYQKLLNDGKKIFLISDMYLPKEVILHLLSKCGISGYRKLYLSNEYRCSKKTGLFDIFIDRENINKESWVHIGDSWRADYYSIFRMRRRGTYGIKISKKMKNYAPYLYKHMKTKKMSDAYEIIGSFVNNHLDTSKSYFYKIGYFVCGPVLYGFTNWLVENVERHGDNKILFFSRDGYIINKAFQAFNVENCTPYYFYISRRSNFSIRLKKDYSLKNILETVHKNQITTVKVMLQRIGAYTEGNIKLAAEMGVDLYSDVFSNQYLEPNVLSFFKIIICKMQKQYCEQALLFEKYVQQFCSSSDRIAVVDTGWNGSSQKAIEIAKSNLNMRAEIHGYYLGVNSEKKGREKGLYAEGFFVDGEEKIGENRFQLRAIAGLLEFIFSAPHGMVERYEQDGQNVIPQLQQYEYINTNGEKMKEVEIASELRQGALDFVEQFNRSSLSKFIKWNAEFSLMPLVNLGIRPKRNELKKFGDILFFDDRMEPLGKPKPLVRYLIHPSQLKQDFAKAGWKLGFMRRLFGNLPLPYYSIYKYLLKKFEVV